jgi:hypothetical protein
MGICAGAAALAIAAPARAQQWRLVGWNNLGMHCMDADFSLWAILPPYNTIHAQLIDPQGRRVSDPEARGIVVSYEAAGDPDGSINTTSADKTNFWQHAQGLFGVTLPADHGLAGSAMPGPHNAPQPMRYDAALGWFIAEGIPITPYDDGGAKNYYPLMRLVARDAAGAELARTDIVLPVSDELSCKGCHGSGAMAETRPPSGWAYDPDPELDFRRNVLQLHDDRHLGEPLYLAALAAGGYDPLGLVASATRGKATLCATCHASEALPGLGVAGIKPLTQSVHAAHALLDDGDQGRTACYRCHPGSVTRCLRGAMGAAVAADGSLAMQCQSCHGGMRDVAAPTRIGWLQEPACQSCHTGTAVRNNGAIRFTSVFEPDGREREAVDATFATNRDTPAAGLSLYRFSAGHGGLKCEACHGSTHAEYPAAHRNDNLQSIALQGHAGMLSECTTCHPASLRSASGGPHGMHSIGNAWVSGHGDAAERDAGACRACHGTDDRGTELSRVQSDRVLQTEFGSKVVWRGFQVGCYMCHDGPRSENANPNRAPVVRDLAIASGPATALDLIGSDADGDALSFRIVAQPMHGTVALSDRRATYRAEAGYTGADAFTYAAWDGDTNSNLGTVSVSVGASGASPTPTTTPSRTAPPPTATVTAPRPTGTATAAASPTRTALPRTATPSVAATFTTIASRTATPTPTATFRLAPSATATSSRTATRRATMTPSRRPTATATATPTRRATRTPTPRQTATPTRTVTPWPTRTPTRPAATRTPTRPRPTRTPTVADD